MSFCERPGNYFVIEDWMVKKLLLKSNELIIYALIHGFSQDGRSYFYGSIKYIMENTNLSKETVLTVLQSLVKKKLIVKKDVKNYQIFDNKMNAQGSQHFCLYYTAASRERSPAGQESVPAPQEEENHGSRNLTRRVQNLDPYGSRILTGTGQEFVPNTLLDNKFDTATSENKNSEQKKKFGILKKSEEAEDAITNELKKLFGGHLVFDSEFVPEISRLLTQFEIQKDKTPAYLKFAFELAEAKKPKSLTNMYYKLAKSPAVMQDFILEAKKGEEKSSAAARENTETCPVCGSKAKTYGECPSCRFDMTKRGNASEVALQKQILALDDDERQRFYAEYNAEIARQNSFGFGIAYKNPALYRDFRERIAEIYRKYGISA